MPLPFWEVKKAYTKDIEGWPWQLSYLITCTRCGNSIIVPRSWRRKNAYGTAPCPICFKTSRIPKRRSAV